MISTQFDSCELEAFQEALFQLVALWEARGILSGVARIRRICVSHTTNLDGLQKCVAPQLQGESDIVNSFQELSRLA